MDRLLGQDLDDYVSGALHTSRVPTNVLVRNSHQISAIEENNARLVEDFATRRGRVARDRVIEKRLASSRLSSSAAGGDVYAAIPRLYNPEQYYETAQIPYNIHNDKHRLELYKWLDLFYRTHYLIPILVDIFTRFPLVGMDLYSPDDSLADFYKGLFFDDLKYGQFFVDMGREYWTLGQSYPLGHFNETLGVWSEEELLDPALVTVKKFPIIGTEQAFLTPPPDLVQLVKQREPRPLYELLVNDHEDIIPFLRDNKPIPVSDVLLKQVAFKANKRDTYGTPILLRALRTLMHEEKLMASQDAIAERLYAPLLLAKLGIQDMGPNRPPFIPGPDHIASLRNDLDIALSADFRLLVHHFGIDIQSVFGREQMPRLGDDFDRVERRLMHVFGVNPSLLEAGSNTQPYASSALQAEFLNQILKTYQDFLIQHYKERAYIVAEAQGHYAYEKRGDTRIPIEEEVLITDPETGEQYIETRKKLMIPELRMKVLDLRDEASQRNFLQAARQQGVPIPDQEMAMGMHFDFNEWLARVEEETIAKTVAQQEAKVKSYDICAAKGLPIPADLKAEVEGAGLGAPAPGTAITPDVQPVGPGDQIMMPPPPGTDQPELGYDDTRGTFPEQSTQTMGPQLPGVPGQPGQLGIPGAPTQAIGPAGPTSSMYREAKVGEDGTESILEKLPRKLTSFEMPPAIVPGWEGYLQDDDSSDTLDE